MEKNLTSGNVLKNLVYFSLPYLLSYFLQTLYGMADLFIIGQFEGVAGTTAVSVGSQVMHMLTVMIVGLAMGATVSIGQAVGAKDRKKAADCTGNTVTVFLVLSVILTAVLLLSVRGIVSVMSTPEEAVEGAVRYLIVCFLGIPFITAYNIISSIFRGLGDSKYNERRSECETALAEIQEVVGINSLGDLTEEQFEQYKSAIKDDVRTKRAKHAVYENQRTIKAVAALKANDIAQFGQLMNASHVSLRDDYEVTGIELDTLVEEAWKVDGVIGSRMTGAGFGGCTVSIVKTEAIDGFIEKVGAEYLKKIGYAADFYVVEIGDGPSLI